MKIFTTRVIQSKEIMGYNNYVIFGKYHDKKTSLISLSSSCKRQEKLFYNSEK